MKNIKRKTNVEFVKDLMESSNYGPMAQAMVIECLDRWTQHLIDNATPEEFENSFVTYESWIGTAKEIQQKLKEKY